MSNPQINVTPLIDVLLVLLIIFMVVTPMKPSAFEARVPSEPKPKPEKVHPWTLVVTVREDSTLQLNNNDTHATVAEPEGLVRQLSEIFEDRIGNQAFIETSGEVSKRIERTVFIRAPRGISYGSVAKVVDAVKLAGADPVSLQIDSLE